MLHGAKATYIGEGAWPARDQITAEKNDEQRADATQHDILKLQDYVLAVTVKLTSEHHPTLLETVKPGTPDCGARALRIIEEFIVPKTGHTAQELDYAYNVIKNSMTKTDDVYEYFQKLLQAHKVKTHVAMYFDATLTDGRIICSYNKVVVLVQFSVSHVQLFFLTAYSNYAVILNACKS